MDRSLTEKMTQSFLLRFPDKWEWNYVDGLFLECVMRVGRSLGIKSFTDRVKKAYDVYVQDDGSIPVYHPEAYSLDLLSPGKVLFDLYEVYGEEKYRKALEPFHRQILSQPRIPEGGFWHKKIYPNQMWLDGLYMQASFRVRWAALGGGMEEALKDEASQFSLIYSKTRIPGSGLLIHAWDEARVQKWADPETGLSQNVWARAMGWYCMALVDTLIFMPKDAKYDPYRATFLALINSLVKPLLRVQDKESGLWWNVLDQGPREGNYLESSASSMFIYALLRLVRENWCTSEKPEIVKKEAIRAYEALLDRKLVIDEEGYHLTDICRGAGLGSYGPGCPYRDGSYAYYCSEPRVWDNRQGVGPFLLASLEAEKAE